MPRKRKGSKAEYDHYRYATPDKFKKKSFKTVPLHHANYKGEKFAEWNKKGSGALAIVAKKKEKPKRGNQWGLQAILIPKKKS